MLLWHYSAVQTQSACKCHNCSVPTQNRYFYKWHKPGYTDIVVSVLQILHLQLLTIAIRYSLCHYVRIAWIFDVVRHAYDLQATHFILSISRMDFAEKRNSSLPLPIAFPEHLLVKKIYKYYLVSCQSTQSLLKLP